MSCLDDDTVAELLAGELSPGARHRVEAHLDACDDCRELVAHLVHHADAPDGATDINPQMADTELPASPAAETSLSELGEGHMVDHFRVERLLGRGGMGRVYLARDTRLGRRIALKVIRPSLLGAEEALARFQREARATARMHHANIVTIHAVGDHEGLPYVALEYVPGVTLGERMRSPLALAETLRIGISVADALAHAHQSGVFHRDLKPANILIGKDDTVRVLDFGLAKLLEVDDAPDAAANPPALVTETTSTTLAGTPRYMAPEQWRGERVGPATDVWALGVVLYYMISGRPPFEADTTPELATMICSDSESPQLVLRDDWPPHLTIVSRCLDKDPAGRPSAALIAAALRSALAYQPPAPTPRRPRTGVVGLGAGVVAGVALFAVVLFAGLGGGDDPVMSREPPAASPPNATPTPSVQSPAAPLTVPTPAVTVSSRPRRVATQPATPPPATVAPAASASEAPASTSVPLRTDWGDAK